MARLVKKVFTADGSWTAPSGITNVILVGYGGGGSGAVGCKTTGSGNLQGGGGGGGATLYSTIVEVVPNTTYTITIGDGGAGVTSTNAAGGTNGNDGEDTSFGSLAIFRGASGPYYPENTTGGSGGVSVESDRAGTVCYDGTTSPPHAFSSQAGSCSSGAVDSFFWSRGSDSPQGYTGGATGSTSTRFGGGGGGAGPGGNGTAGTNGSTGNSSSSSAAAANSGAGSGGSGAANSNTGNTGAGGSGKLTIYYVE